MNALVKQIINNDKSQVSEYNEEKFLNVNNETSNSEFKNYLNQKLNINILDEGMELYNQLQQKLEKPTLVEFIYPFALYAIKQVEKEIQTVLTLNERYEWGKIKQSLADAIATELVGLISKTVTLELQIEKLRETLEGETPEERFESFIIKHARDLGYLNRFYEEYPLLKKSLFRTYRIFY